MEAVPRLPMLYFELKTSEEKANFPPKLRNVSIDYKYLPTYLPTLPSLISN